MTFQEEYHLSQELDVIFRKTDMMPNEPIYEDLYTLFKKIFDAGYKKGYSKGSSDEAVYWNDKWS